MQFLVGICFFVDEESLIQSPSQRPRRWRFSSPSDVLHAASSFRSKRGSPNVLKKTGILDEFPGLVHDKKSWNHKKTSCTLLLLSFCLGCFLFHKAVKELYIYTLATANCCVFSLVCFSNRHLWHLRVHQKYWGAPQTGTPPIYHPGCRCVRWAETQKLHAPSRISVHAFWVCRCRQGDLLFLNTRNCDSEDLWLTESSPT